MTNQLNILPTDAVARQAAVDAACSHAGLPRIVTRRVAVVDVTQSQDDEEDRYVFDEVGTEDRVRFVPCAATDVDEDGDRISSYSDGMDGSFDDFDRCESYCLDHEAGVPGRVRFWSEEDEFIDAQVDGFLGFVDIDVPYMIFGTEDDYSELVASAARAAAVEAGLIEE